MPRSTSWPRPSGGRSTGSDNFDHSSACTSSSPPRFLAGLLLAATVSTVLSCVSAAGEEIGWRGYVLTRLIEGGIPCPVLAGGVIWGLWHVLLIVTGLYVAGGQQSMVVTLSVFIVGATAFAFVLARFRLQTGSIWPVIVLHGRGTV